MSDSKDRPPSAVVMPLARELVECIITHGVENISLSSLTAALGVALGMIIDRQPWDRATKHDEYRYALDKIITLADCAPFSDGSLNTGEFNIVSLSKGCSQ